MAEEIVVKEPLWSGMMKAGEELTKRLDDLGFDLVASFWFFVPEAGEWRLLLASPQVDINGPKAAYTIVQKALDPQLEGLSLHNISVVSPSMPIVQILNEVARTGAQEIGGMRVTRDRINNIFIEDAYIYRMAA